MATDAFFFISFGGPEKREDIRPFLESVTRGRGIPAERLDEVAHHYEVMGGASPINAITFRQAAALQKVLAKTDTPWPVYVGNRNWHPWLEETLRKMVADGVKRAVGFVAAGYRCEASWERYIKAVEAARQKVGTSAPAVTYTTPWFDHPLFIEAIAARVKEALSKQPSPHPSPEKGEGAVPSPLSGEGGRRPGEGPSWLFTAHSIPVPMAEASRYVQELSRTAELVAETFGIKNWKLAYTSRSGAPTDPWLEPDVCDEIRAQAKNGVREIFAVPIGFIADHIEVLFDLDVEAKEAARNAGVSFRRAQTVGDHPLFIQMIADNVRKTAAVLA